MLDLRGLYALMGSLKTTVRTGWMINGVPPAVGETVAEHSFESAVWALVLALEARRLGIDVDPYRAVAIAIVHDLAEGAIGDLAKWVGDHVGDLKRELETEALSKTVDIEEIKELFLEFLSGSTTESKIARLGELLATYFQARRYVDAGFRRVEGLMEAVRREILNFVAREMPMMQDLVTKLLF